MQMHELRFTAGEENIKAEAWLSSLLDALDAGKKYVVSVKEQKSKRSLNANSYFWSLCDQLAVAMGIGKTELYQNYVREIGGNNESFMCRKDAVEALRKHWSDKGLGWVTDTLPALNEEWVEVIVYFGSSTYDTAQMSRLINLAVQDCKEFGIQTLDDLEIERLAAEWGEKNNG